MWEKCWFWGEGKTGVPGEKPLGAEKRTNKLTPHMTPRERGRGENRSTRRKNLSGQRREPTNSTHMINTLSRLSSQLISLYNHFFCFVFLSLPAVILGLCCILSVLGPLHSSVISCSLSKNMIESYTDKTTLCQLFYERGWLSCSLASVKLFEFEQILQHGNCFFRRFISFHKFVLYWLF